MKGEFISIESARINADIEKENERLNNVICELEKWLIEWKNMIDCPDFYEEGIIDCINDTLLKIKELKGD